MRLGYLRDVHVHADARQGPFCAEQCQRRDAVHQGGCQPPVERARLVGVLLLHPQLTDHLPRSCRDESHLHADEKDGEHRVVLGKLEQPARQNPTGLN